MSVNYDVVLHVLHFIYDDSLFEILAQCASVNQEFCRAALCYLYRRVTISPRSDAAKPQLDLSRRNQKLNGLFESARLPRNASFVTELVIGGWLLPTSAPRNNFSTVLKAAIALWPNLRSITMMPHTAPKELMDAALSALNSSWLISITVDSKHFTDETLPLLLSFKRLRILSILNPNRAILQVLPAWLSDLCPSLDSFQLLGNCGSVTPGVLRSFLPHLTRIHTFALGLSYSLTNDDVFACLDQMPQIQSLDLRYYLQLRSPSIRPFLPTLRSLTVRYSDIGTRQGLYHFIKWIRQASAHSPLHTIRLINDSRFDIFCCITYDGLLNHLGSKHKDTLISIRLEGCTVGKKAIQDLCSECTMLEELTASVRFDAVWNIPELSNLCTVLLTTPHVRRRLRKVYNDDERVAREVFRQPSRLRRLGINEHRWKTGYQPAHDGGLHPVIQRTSIPQPHAWEESEEQEWREGRKIYDM